jgi:hypothetical protein
MKSSSFSLYISNSLISNHTARIGAGISAIGGCLDIGPNVNITLNSATQGGGGDGGGLYLLGAQTTLKEGVMIANNTAAMTGGGISWFPGVCDKDKGGYRHCTQLNISARALVAHNRAQLAGKDAEEGRCICVAV